MGYCLHEMTWSLCHELVEEAQRIGLDLDSSNSTPLAVSNEHEWVLVFRHDVRTGGLFSSHMGWEEANLDPIRLILRV